MVTRACFGQSSSPPRSGGEGAGCSQQHDVQSASPRRLVVTRASGGDPSSPAPEGGEGGGRAVSSMTYSVTCGVCHPRRRCVGADGRASPSEPSAPTGDEGQQLLLLRLRPGQPARAGPWGQGPGPSCQCPGPTWAQGHDAPFQSHEPGGCADRQVCVLLFCCIQYFDTLKKLTDEPSLVPHHQKVFYHRLEARSDSRDFFAEAFS